MTTNPRNILQPLTITIPDHKNVNFLADLDNTHINKSFELDCVSEDSLNNLQILQLQIQQLKRENTFLKRKIWELQLGKPTSPLKAHRKQSLNCFNILKKNALLTANDPKQNSLQCIFIEIQNILESLASIHKIEINKQLWLDSEQNKEPLLSLEEISFIKESKMKKQKIGKKLQIIGLQSEEVRYGALLQVFTDFYMLKSEQESRVKRQVERFIEKTLEIGKQMIDQVMSRSRSRSMRSSCLSTGNQKTTNEPFSPCSGNKQNLCRFQPRIKTERNQSRCAEDY